MKDFLSNSWVVSIISGIIVFFLTNAIIMLQNKRKYKKQISDANSMMLNRLRGYVVDNGLPDKEIINAVKASTSREYNIKFEELLSIKELCEELVTDIISNIYISNENKVKYINMLQTYLKDYNNINNIEPKDNNKQDEYFGDVQQEIQKMKKEIRKEIIRRTSLSFGMLISVLLAILSAISVFVSSMDISDINIKNTEIYIEIIAVVVAAMIITKPIILDCIKKIIEKKK